MINMASSVYKEEYTKEWESTTPVDDKIQELGRILIKDFKGILEMSFASRPSGKCSLLSPAQELKELKLPVPTLSPAPPPPVQVTPQTFDMELPYISTDRQGLDLTLR